MRLVQFLAEDGQRCVGVVAEDEVGLQIVTGFDSVYALALAADRAQTDLASLVQANLGGDAVTSTGSVQVDYEAIIQQKRLLPPLDHPDPAHCLVTGTGLTHLGSAKARDDMHQQTQAQTDKPVTDSMRMFQWGLEGGKPPQGEISVQPEWFYKGNGRCVIAPEQALPMPAFALDGGEEPEVVGLYVIGDAGHVLRVGFALGNEFSDHVMEKQNYLYLAHSKLRPCSFGPELLLGELPEDIRGTVRIWRDDAVLWQRPFLTGETNMSYHIASLEHHHFKYDEFRRPGDVHVHFFGTGTLSFADGITTQPGDLFAIEAPGFGRPLRNQLQSPENKNHLIIVKPI
ncbi:MAG: hypothetical protein KDE48_23325 [Anaerolineales bacterium]|nr:hypothetical protein [Anaerolineales bacterium]